MHFGFISDAENGVVISADVYLGARACRKECNRYMCHQISRPGDGSPLDLENVSMQEAFADLV